MNGIFTFGSADFSNLIRAGSYKINPNSRQDLDSYRDADGVLHRTALIIWQSGRLSRMQVENLVVRLTYPISTVSCSYSSNGPTGNIILTLISCVISTGSDRSRNGKRD